MSLNQPYSKYKYEITSLELLAVEVKSSDYAARLARVAEALYPLLTSSESSKKSVSPDGTPSSSIHLHEPLTAESRASGERDVSDGKDEPKTAA